VPIALSGEYLSGYSHEAADALLIPVSRTCSQRIALADEGSRNFVDEFQLSPKFETSRIPCLSEAPYLGLSVVNIIYLITS
jgi:hypothetical protein